MKLLMDADCLIKFTKAGFKKTIVDKINIFIPQVVKEESVDAGKQKGCDDAFLIEKNIKAKKIKVVHKSKKYVNGDQALTDLFDSEKYLAVATDDAKLSRVLRLRGIPFLLPAVVILKLFRDRKINRNVALEMLEKLRPFISDDEYSTVRIILEKKL